MPAPLHPEFDVFRDYLGYPVFISYDRCQELRSEGKRGHYDPDKRDWVYETFTPDVVKRDELYALMHTWQVRCILQERDGKFSLWPDGPKAQFIGGVIPGNGYGATTANFDKSVLCGRMLYEGLPPQKYPPPTLWSAPQYKLADRIWDYEGNESDFFDFLTEGMHDSYVWEAKAAVKYYKEIVLPNIDERI